MVGLAPLRSDETVEALAYLARRPYENAYVAWLLRTRQIGRKDDVVVWRDASDAIAGLALIASRLVPCAESPEALGAFADRARATVREPRLIVGPKDVVDPFWLRLRDAMPPPAAVRSHQPVYALAAGDVRACEPIDDVGLAVESEVDELAIESAAMTSGEVGYHVVADAAFRRRTARIVAMGWLWRCRVSGELAYMCHVGAETAQTVQLQGVWTPPALRGHGYATRALAEIVRRLLLDYPTVSLSVNDFNAPAIALYERVGFQRAGALSSIIFA